MSAKTWNDYRVVPRILIISYYIFFAYAWLWVVGWFMTYEFTEIENELVALAVVAFPGGILTILTTVLGTLTNNYFRTGNGNGKST